MENSQQTKLKWLKTFKEMYNILTHQRNENQNKSEILSNTCRNGQDQKH